MHNFGQGKIISVKVAPRDPNRIYVSHQQNGSNWNIWRTNDGGLTWVEVTIPTSVGGNNADKPIYLDVDGTNPDLLWAIFIGNHQGNKVFKSVNGGDTWTNITTPTIGNQYGRPPSRTNAVRATRGCTFEHHLRVSLPRQRPQRMGVLQYEPPCGNAHTVYAGQLLPR